MSYSNVIFIKGKRKDEVKKALFHCLGFFNSKDFIVTEKIEDLREAKKSVIIITDFNKEDDLPSFDNFGKAVKLINFDDKLGRKYLFSENLFSFGFNDGADFLVSDIKKDNGINFKLNHAGKVIPIWLDKTSNENNIFSVLCAISSLSFFDFNILDICQSFRNFY